MMSLPRVSVAADAVGVAKLAADVVELTLTARPAAVLALPTGRTPIPLYEELVARYRARRIDFSRALVFNLDEWVGVAPDDAGSFTRFMDEHFFSKVTVPVPNRFIQNGNAPDLEAECRRYEELIREAGGLDLVVLGLGHNGHIGFNEPGTPFDSRTHIVQVTPETRRANAYAFSGREPPSLGLSMGIGTILNAREVLLLVTGADKAGILARALGGPIDESMPATALRGHPALHVIADRSAATASEPARG
jgi:glucosamine-6-phosphate deaminase